MNKNTAESLLMLVLTTLIVAFTFYQTVMEDHIYRISGSRMLGRIYTLMFVIASVIFLVVFIRNYFKGYDNIEKKRIVLYSVYTGLFAVSVFLIDRVEHAFIDPSLKFLTDMVIAANVIFFLLLLVFSLFYNPQSSSKNLFLSFIFVPFMAVNLAKIIFMPGFLMFFNWGVLILQAALFLMLFLDRPEHQKK